MGGQHLAAAAVAAAAVVMLAMLLLLLPVAVPSCISKRISKLSLGVSQVGCEREDQTNGHGGLEPVEFGLK
jgi:hypothetical protein